MMFTAPSFKLERIYLLLLGSLTWSALALQFYQTVVLSTAKGRALVMVVVFYFSFFTILTNLLIALVTTCSLSTSRSRLCNFWASVEVASATAVYITVVFAVYWLLLRQFWRPTGVQKIADILLHGVVPVMYVGYWVLYVRGYRLRWKSALWWLTFPLGYLFCILIRGALIAHYPYPFLDVVTLGYPRALANAFGICGAIFLLSLLLVSFTRWSAKSASEKERERISPHP
jgi:hypothetical protein